jgi:hypothetical protein
MEKKAFFAVAKKPWEKEPNGKAQISLEYLLTYSWALVLVASIVGVVVLLFGGPIETPVFSSSQPTEFPLVGGGNIDAANNVSVVLKNASGGAITVTSFLLGSGFKDPANGTCGASTLNTITCSVISGPPASPVSVPPGDELRFSSIKYPAGGVGTITVTYKDKTAFSRTLTITGKKGTR